ncbi:phage baseplate assembly protein V [Undibacterium sp. JH2W]|uniref:phage baseplate assembly protein V n=1 Tax=Undibacterium sp. JH2W TaxID=3413037 RepID=UPI003BEF5A72
MNELSGTLYLGVVDTVKLDANGCLDVYLPALKSILQCRVATAMAGAGRGVLFLPEKGDQVLVVPVLGSDIGFALLSSVWHLNAKPPGGDGTITNDVKLIQTRGGNKISLIDTEGKESIEISTKDKQQCIRFSIEEGHIEITAGAIKMKGNVEIDGTLTVNTGGHSTAISGNEITGK